MELLNEPQAWTLFEVCGVTMVELLAIVTQLVSAKFERVHERIDARLDGLDRDAQALITRAFPLED